MISHVLFNYFAKDAPVDDILSLFEKQKHLRAKSADIVLLAGSAFVLLATIAVIIAFNAAGGNLAFVAKIISYTTIAPITIIGFLQAIFLLKYFICLKALQFLDVSQKVDTFYVSQSDFQNYWQESSQESASVTDDPYVAFRNKLLEQNLSAKRLLGLEDGVEITEIMIDKQFKYYSLKLHPDKNKDRLAEADLLFKCLTAAKDAAESGLKNPNTYQFVLNLHQFLSQSEEQNDKE